MRRDPERAWRLQAERAGGRLPKLCKEPAYLQYRKICSLGGQIQKLFEFVPPSQRLIVVLDNLDRNPATVHKQITDFLGIEATGTTEFQRENVFTVHESRAIARTVRLFHVSPRLKALRLRFKPALNRHGIYPLTWATNFSLRKAVKPKLSEDFTP